MKIAGILLLVLGLVALAAGTFSFTTKEKVVDLGPIDVTHDKTTSQTIPPAVSVGIIAIGGLLLVIGARQHA